ncbi:MAG: 16S rRNA (cytosine(967)-C(5))-methyltransferase RsmB [Desulfobacterales bacterium]|nr:MAG: 16S rRNA (cytosine(967)-C(5))-methyltransferase RsmB [Desulfobacterales bacterium]
MALDVRKTALLILNALETGRQTLDHLLEEACSANVRFAQRDRALLNALVYGVLRWRGRLDFIIAKFSQTPPRKIDSQVLNILRLGLFQIIYLDRVPDSAAVNTSVELTKSMAAPWVSGFVNALLRRAARDHRRVAFPKSDDDPVTALAAGKSFPPWLVERWLKRFTPAQVGSFCDALNTIPPTTLRTNTLRTSRAKLLQALAGEVATIEPTAFAPDGLCCYQPKTPVPKLKGFADGWFQVQDEAAQLVSLFFNPQPGDTVLDACAGLGGKTGHIAQLMQDRGTITALDHNSQKLRQLRLEMQRLGLSSVSTCPHDLDNPWGQPPAPRFDGILLDAPCSGLGTMRRNPDVKWASGKQNLRRYQTRQLKFLDRLAPLAKPSGIMVYAVCSTEPEETHEVVQAFLKKRPEFAIDTSLGELPPKALTAVDAQGYFRTFPFLNTMDGFFAVRLRRIS